MIRFGKKKHGTDGRPAATPGPTAPLPQDMRRVHLRFKGEVQGVGFRWTSQRVANSLGLTGWVKNIWDGSVEMELQGTDDQICDFFGEFANSYRRYPIHYVIDEKEDIALLPDEGGFRVRA